MDVTSNIDREDFLNGFLSCAEWASTEVVEDEYGHQETKDIDSFNFDFAQSAIEKAKIYCNKFIDTNYNLLAYECVIASQAGHDLWLSSHGFGCGYCDRYMDKGNNQYPRWLGDALHKSAMDDDKVKNLFVYVDGKNLYLSG